MVYKRKMNSQAPINKIVPFVLVLSLILAGTGIASGKTISARKSPQSQTLRSMARVYMAYGEYAKAQPLAEKALTMAKRNGSSDSELAMCLIDLGTLYNSQNKLDDAAQMCELGLKLQKKLLYENHPYLAYTLSTLSSIYREQGNYSQARKALDEAMTIMLDAHSADDKAMAPFFVDTAKLLVAQYDLEKAESYYQKAMNLINKSYGPNHLYTANVIASIAELNTMQGKYDQAEKLINKAIAIQEKIYGSEHHLVVPSWLTKAKICQAKGQFAKTDKLINRTLAAIDKSDNAAAFAKLRKDAKDLRLSKQVAFASTSRTIK